MRTLLGTTSASPPRTPIDDELKYVLTELGSPFKAALGACSPAGLFNLKAESCGYLLERYLSGLLDPFHLGVCGLRDTDAASDFGLCEAEVLTPCGHSGYASLERQIDGFVRGGAVCEAALHTTELVIGHGQKCGLAVLANDDLKLST